MYRVGGKDRMQSVVGSLYVVCGQVVKLSPKYARTHTHARMHTCARAHTHTHTHGALQKEDAELMNMIKIAGGEQVR